VAPNESNVYDPDLYVMNSDGTGRMRLTTGLGSAWTPTWSPDGSRIAYVWTTSPPNHPEKRSEIFVVHSDGSGRVNLAAGSDPAWSPDGSKIAIAQDTDIFVIDANGGNLRRLTTTDGSGLPVWSPDGSRIAFTLFGFESAVAVVNSDGTDLRTLMPGHSPTWRPRRP
jgi:Tol biopolymer transport system component